MRKILIFFFGLALSIFSASFFVERVTAGTLSAGGPCCDGMCSSCAYYGAFATCPAGPGGACSSAGSCKFGSSAPFTVLTCMY